MKFQNSSCSREGGGLGGVKGVRKINFFFAKCICRGVGRLAGAWWASSLPAKTSFCDFCRGVPPSQKNWNFGILGQKVPFFPYESSTYKIPIDWNFLEQIPVRSGIFWNFLRLEPNSSDSRAIPTNWNWAGIAGIWLFGAQNSSSSRAIPVCWN